MLLHADLENKNILVSDARDLVAIDPLPCLGEPAYDAAYWAVAAEGASVQERSTLLATELGLDPERVRAWAAVIALEVQPNRPPPPLNPESRRADLAELPP